jgi:DNA-binding GntR family transcriptional regulator
MVYAKNKLHNKIFEALRDRIVRMDYPPGMNLEEKSLCEEFNVSRTPLREAIHKLEEKGLVTVIPRFGTHVSQVNIDEIRHAYEIKVDLEGLAGMLAAERITPSQLELLNTIIEERENLLKNKKSMNILEVDAQFHNIIYEATNNPLLQEILENLRSRVARLWNSTLDESISKAEVIRQMRQIYQSLKSRNPERASDLLKNHVKYFVDKTRMQIL